MEIIIHRGTHQIGGCITEIKSEEARIIIDMGSPLPGSKGEDEFDAVENTAIAIPGVTVASGDDTVQPCDAVIITHYHGDHIGRIDALLPDIPLYMGQTAKDLYAIYCNRTEQTGKVNRLQVAHRKC